MGFNWCWLVVLFVEILKICPWLRRRHRGRVVKASDSKSDGVFLAGSNPVGVGKSFFLHPVVDPILSKCISMVIAIPLSCAQIHDDDFCLSRDVVLSSYDRLVFLPKDTNDESRE